jgi:hypothetical protein
MIRRGRLSIAALAACGLLASACGLSKENTSPMSTSTSASRPPPPDVAPVILGTMRYAQHAGTEAADGQVGGILAAYDAAGRLQWTLKVYENRRRADIEGDAQDVYFRSMAADPDGRLRIVNESGDTFLVDVHTRAITALPSTRPAIGTLRVKP